MVFGSSLHRYFLKCGIKNIITASKKKLNLLNSKELEKFIKIKKPNIIINCAGRISVEYWLTHLTQLNF